VGSGDYEEKDFSVKLIEGKEVTWRKRDGENLLSTMDVRKLERHTSGRWGEYGLY